MTLMKKNMMKMVMLMIVVVEMVMMTKTKTKKTMQILLPVWVMTMSTATSWPDYLHHNTNQQVMTMASKGQEGLGLDDLMLFLNNPACSVVT